MYLDLWRLVREYSEKTFWHFLEAFLCFYKLFLNKILAFPSCTEMLLIITISEPPNNGTLNKQFNKAFTLQRYIMQLG